MTLIKEYKEDIDIDDLPEPYQVIALKVDLDTALTIAILFQGSSIYFPKLDCAIQPLRDKRIFREFTGENYQELARKYNLSERRVRQIVHQQQMNENQTNIFDFTKE
ncbi:hypothetical protein JCM16358_22970 [Halanaerocella petrolearia]